MTRVDPLADVTDEPEITTEQHEVEATAAADAAPVEAVTESAPAEDSGPTAAELKAKAEQLEKEIETSVEHLLTVARGVGEANVQGFVSDEQIKPVLDAFRDVVGGAKGKNRARKALADEMSAQVAKGRDNFDQVMAWNLITDAVGNYKSTSTGDGAPRTPAMSPAEAFAAQVGAVELGYGLLLANVPADAEDWESHKKFDFEAANDLYRWHLEGDPEEGVEKRPAPAVGIVEAAAVKVALGKAGGKPRAKSTRKANDGTVSTYEGPRRSVAAHIENAFADVASGTFLSVAEIAKKRSPEYGDEAPSQGAISARLFAKNGCTVPGITPGTGASGAKGATKN